jgi:hypothetical protein
MRSSSELSRHLTFVGKACETEFLYERKRSKAECLPA